MTKVAKTYQIKCENYIRNRQYTSPILTLAELISYYNYTLLCGKSYENEKGRKKINMNPTSIKSLVTNLNNAKNNSAANGYSGDHYSIIE